jgi:hypothetical protein
MTPFRRRSRGMRRIWAALVQIAMSVLLLCRAGSMTPAMAGGIAPPIDSPIFALRPPLPGQLSYLQAIRFIDDGMKYVDPLSAFFVSSAGEMCFFVRPNFPIAIYDAPYRYWCVYPRAVDRVEALANGGEGINTVQLWCRYDAPQCAHRLFYPVVPGKRGWVADNVLVPTVAYRAQQAAIETLIYLMGGYVRPPGPTPLALR